METARDDSYDRDDRIYPRMHYFVFKMAALQNNRSLLQRYECLYNKFSPDYKNSQVRRNCWVKLAEKFNMIAKQAESKYKNIRSSYGRFLKKLKGVPSGSGRDAVPIPGEFANLEWLDQYISPTERAHLISLERHIRPFGNQENARVARVVFSRLPIETTRYDRDGYMPGN